MRAMLLKDSIVVPAHLAAMVAALWSPLLRAGTPDALWSKAVEFANTNAGWIPGLTIIRSEVLFRSEPAAIHEMWQRSSLGSNGLVLTEIVKVLEDNEDV